MSVSVTMIRDAYGVVTNYLFVGDIMKRPKSGDEIILTITSKNANYADAIAEVLAEFDQKTSPNTNRGERKTSEIPKRLPVM